MNHFSEKLLPVLDKIAIVSLFVFAAFCMFSISITQIAAGLGGLAWLLRTHITKTWQEQRWPLGLPFILFVLANLVAVINAYSTIDSYPELKKLLEFLIFFWVVNYVRENRLRDSLSTILILTATLAGLHGFYQGWRDGLNIENRVEGTMSVYMTFAGLLMIVGMMGLGRILFRRPRENWLWFALIVISICLLFTFTRQAWFGFLVGLMFLMFTWQRKATLIIAGLTLVFLLVYGNQIQSQILKETTWKGKTVSFSQQMKYRINRMISGQDETFAMRIALWRGGWEIVKDHPLTGCGFHCVDLIGEQYPDPSGHLNRIRGMHNNFVQLAVDIGFFGLSSWIGIWVCFFGLLYRRAKIQQEDSSSNWIIYGSTAAGLAFLAGGFFETNVYDSEVAMVLYFIMALPFAGSNAFSALNCSLLSSRVA